MNNCTGSAKGLPFLASNTTWNKTIRENYHIPHLALSPPTTVPSYYLALKFPSPVSDLRQALRTPKTILIMTVTLIKDITFPHKPCVLVPPWECFSLHIVGLTTLGSSLFKAEYLSRTIKFLILQLPSTETLPCITTTRTSKHWEDQDLR